MQHHAVAPAHTCVALSRGARDGHVGAGAQSMLKLPDAQLATALGMSQSATAAFRAATKMARFQPVQDGGACARACNITQ